MIDPVDTSDLRRMKAARIGPHVTCPASRHAGMIAEAMALGDQDQKHQGGSIAATVAALWEARAALSQPTPASQDTADLVAELRADAELHQNLLPDRAADALEAQAATLAALRAENERLASKLSEVTASEGRLLAAFGASQADRDRQEKLMAWTSKALDSAEDERDRLQAELARARYVLEGVRGAIDTGRNEPLMIWRSQIDIALEGCATLDAQRETD